MNNNKLEYLYNNNSNLYLYYRGKRVLVVEIYKYYGFADIKFDENSQDIYAVNISDIDENQNDYNPEDYIMIDEISKLICI